MSEDPDLLTTRPGRQGLPKVFWDVLGRWYILALGGIAGFFLSVYYLKKTPEQFAAKTAEFKARLAKGESLDSMRVEAYAVAREAAKQATGMFAYDCQVLGALAIVKLHKNLPRP